MLFNREPALIIGAIQAVLALAVGFGLPVTTIQMGLIMAAAAAVLAVITRQIVVPTEKADNQIATALLMPSTATVAEVKKIEEEGRK